MKRQKIKIELIETNEGQILGVPKNPRYIKGEEFEKLKKSIVDFPEMLTIREVVVFPLNGRFIALGGNMRFLACKELGYKEIDCVILPADMPAEKLKEFAIKDNGSFGNWDFDELANNWDLELLEMANVTIPNFELPEETPEATEDNYEVPAEIKTNIVKGDLFEIGNHRLLCGDSTDSEQVAKLMQGEKADMVFTDPPYNTGMTSKTQSSASGGTLWKGNSKHVGKSWLSHMFEDSYTDTEWEEFMQGFLNSYYLFSKDNIFLFICLDWRRSYQLIPHIKNNFHLSNLIVWDKMIHGLGSDYKYTHEFIHVCKKGEPELARNKDGEKEYYDIWHIQRKIGRDDDHATKKPIELCERAIRHTSNKSDIVLDLFLGSGSTMVAAHQLQRKCYGMELSEKYCQVIIERMLKLDPTLTVKRNGVVTNEFH